MVACQAGSLAGGGTARQEGVQSCPGGGGGGLGEGPVTAQAGTQLQGMRGITLTKSTQGNDASSVLEFCPVEGQFKMMEGGKAKGPGAERMEGWGRQRLGKV